MYNDTRAIKLIKNVILKWAQYMNSTNDKLNNDIDKMIEVMKNLGLVIVNFLFREVKILYLIDNSLKRKEIQNEI